MPDGWGRSSTLLKRGTAPRDKIDARDGRDRTTPKGGSRWMIKSFSEKTRVKYIV